MALSSDIVDCRSVAHHDAEDRPVDFITMNWLLAGTVVSFVAMLWVNGQNGMRLRRVMIATLGSLSTVLAIASLYESIPGPGGCPGPGFSLARETAYTESSYETLGDYIGATFPGANVVVLERDWGEYNAHQELVLDALRNGIGGRATVKRVTVGPDYDPASVAMPDYLINIDEFEAALAAHVPGYLNESEDDPRGVVVLSLLGLPEYADEMEYWSRPADRRPHLVLANANLMGLHTRIADGQIDAVLAHNPTAIFDPDAKVPTTRAAAFAERYLLIRPETAEETAAEHPQIFGQQP
jgi:hypothetical protein